jgi:DNA helicase-2/ATP-dependent DNA helicase PcrA
VDLYSHARSMVRSAEAGQRKVDAIDGVLRSLENHAARSAKPSLARWLERLALDSRQEEDPAEGEGVNLVTFHAAKGLEWPVVYLAGLEEDLLPSAGIQGEVRDLAEERRLCYVGITRARERLTLTRAAARVKRGKVIPRTPSRFLEDLPADAREVIDPEAVRSTPTQVAETTASVMAALRARLGGGA